MEPVNQTLMHAAVFGYHFFNALTPWLIALTFFVTILSWLFIVFNVVALHRGKITQNMFGGHLVILSFAFILFGGAFLWLLGV